MYSYAGLLQKLSERGLTRSSLTEKLGISSRTIAKIERGEKIANRVMQKVAVYLGCSIQDLCLSVSDNVLLQRLRNEKSVHMPDSLYEELQILLTYYSSCMDGKALSEKQTRMIFKKRTLTAAKGIPVDDVIETVNHFRAVDYMIDYADEPLTEDFMKELHRLLKQGTRDADLTWFAVGEYKNLSTTYEAWETAKPNEVLGRMQALLKEYDELPNVTIYDIIRFLGEFAYIQPFQDGNGRVGRLIAVKECLRFDIVPFLIEDSEKKSYDAALKQWRSEKGALTDLCLNGQDTFRCLLAKFDTPPALN